MTATQIAERHIIYRLLKGERRQPLQRPVERLIRGLACAAGLALLFVYLPQFVWVLLSAAVLVSLAWD
jgi:hypothetical protein